MLPTALCHAGGRALARPGMCSPAAPHPWYQSIACLTNPLSLQAAAGFGSAPSPLLPRDLLIPPLISIDCLLA